MQVLVKIFASKVRCNRVSDSDVKVAETIQDYLLKYMKMMLIPAKHIGESIILLLALRKVTKTDLNWFDAFFKVGSPSDFQLIFFF